MGLDVEDNIIEVSFNKAQEVKKPCMLELEDDILESFFEEPVEKTIIDSNQIDQTPYLNLNSNSKLILSSLKEKTDTITDNMKRLKYYLDEMNFS